MQTAMKLKVENSSIRSVTAAFASRYKAQVEQPQPEDKMGHALNMFRKSDLVNRYMQMYKAGELYALDKKN